VVLVGGQALNAWIERYKIRVLEFDGPYLTQDADFLGTKAEAEVIARHLQGRAILAHLDDQTINTALVEFTGEKGQRLLIDMLAGVLGMTNEVAQAFAVPIQLYDWEPVRVLHPLLVLESRCANLEILSSKRTGNGIAQARAACLVAQAYVQDGLSTPDRRREALKAARRISALAMKRSGIYVWKRWGIDVLDAIDAREMPGQFSRSWQHELGKVERKREIARRLPSRPMR
jgi:hypothetical protein